MLLLLLRKTVMRLREMQRRRAKKKQMMRVMVMVSVDTLERERNKQRSTERERKGVSPLFLLGSAVLAPLMRVRNAAHLYPRADDLVRVGDGDRHELGRARHQDIFCIALHILSPKQERGEGLHGQRIKSCSLDLHPS